MNFLRTIITDGRTALPESRHADFIAALTHSLTVPPYEYTPDSFEPFGFTQRELYDLKLLLLRPLAWQFIHELEPAITESRFNKRTTFDAYVAAYGRNPLLVSVRPRIMMLTYSEWMDLALGAVKPVDLAGSL